VTIKITGTGIGLPKRSVANQELADITGLDTSDEWIVSKTGITSRYLCQDERLSDLAAEAARNALADAGTGLDQVDYVLCATIGADTRTPSLACLVAGELGLTCPAVDLNAACMGFVYALDTAAALVETGRASTVVIVCAEQMSSWVDWTDRATCVLFGDGAAACVVTAGSALKYTHLRTVPDLEAIHMRNNAHGNSPFAVDQPDGGYVVMDGQKVFKYAVSMIEREVAEAVAALNITTDDIDYYLIHQANRRILDFAVSRSKQSRDKFPMNIERYGNVSAVSIPLLLHEQRAAGKVHPGQTLLLCAVGAGMTCGSCVLEWE
jgi:3-oxoacyl-[acyl-carrier-protein] synthase-3